jgi:hypothetical protein
MRILPTLCVSGWLVAPVTLPSLSAVEWLAGVAQAQQLSPPETSGPNRIQKEPFDPFQSEPLFGWYQGLIAGVEPSNPPTNNLPTSDWLSSLWLNSVTDSLNDLWAEQAARERRTEELWRSVFFSVKSKIGPSVNPGKGDYWKPGEFDRLIGPR